MVESMGEISLYPILDATASTPHGWGARIAGGERSRA